MIDYFVEECSMPSLNFDRVNSIINEEVLEAGFSIEQINYIFCTDEYLLKINRDYLDHDYYTDIITFPLQNNPIVADIFISIERVKDNAATLNVKESHELLRVIFHGVLHLIGYNDKEEQDEKRMREREDSCIDKY